MANIGPFRPTTAKSDGLLEFPDQPVPDNIVISPPSAEAAREAGNALRMMVSGHGSTGNPPRSGSPATPGGINNGSEPPDEENVIALWMRALGLEGDPQITKLTHSQRRTLARIATVNRGHAVGLVNSMARMPQYHEGRKTGGRGNLQLALDICESLFAVSVRNIGSCFLQSALLSEEPRYALSAMHEMLCIAEITAEMAALGYYSTIHELLPVPWHVLPRTVLGRYSRRWPTLTADQLQTFGAKMEVDVHVRGDRLIEIKQRKDRPIYDVEEGDDAIDQACLQLQAPKLIAASKGRGLRGVEFILFGSTVDGGWLNMVRELGQITETGIRVVLHRAGTQAYTLLDTLGPTPRRGRPISVVLQPLRSPPAAEENGNGTSRRWGEAVSREGLELMLRPISDERLHARLGHSPRSFVKNIGVHAHTIVDYLYDVIEAAFKELDEVGTNSHKRWLDSIENLNERMGGDGTDVDENFARDVATLASGLCIFLERHGLYTDIVTDDEDKDDDSGLGGGGIAGTGGPSSPPAPPSGTNPTRSGQALGIMQGFTRGALMACDLGAAITPINHALSGAALTYFSTIANFSALLT